MAKTIPQADQISIEESHYKNGQLKLKQCFKSGKLHQDGDHPATERYYVNGQIDSKQWYKDGVLHREGDQPAAEHYYDEGPIRLKAVVQQRNSL